MIEIKVSATSANMGPGFDCLGVALNMHNTFYIDETDGELEILGCDDAYKNEDNLVYKSVKRCFERLGYSNGKRGLRITIKSEIPASRGLGSSASCILAGVLAANEIATGHLCNREILELAAEIEGHPDNITPALYGGMQVSIREGCRVYSERVQLPQGIKFCAVIPDFILSTKEARSVLPKSIAYSDAVFNIGRTSLLLAALSNGNFDRIKAACMDKLHENYRGVLIKDYHEIIDACSSLGSSGVFLSGAGPTIMNILKEEDNEFAKDMEYYLSSLKERWIVKELKPYFGGAVVKKVNVGEICYE